MTPVQILYIHGYDDSSYGDTYQNIKKSLEKYPKIILHTISWSLTNSDISTERLKIINYINDNKIDIVIGYSIGAYLASSINKYKVLINPFLNNIQLGILGLYPDCYASYNNQLWNDWGPNNKYDIWMCSSSKDNVVGTNSYNLINKLFKNSKVYRRIFDSEHKLDKDNIDIVIEEIMKIVNSDKQLLKKYNECDENELDKFRQEENNSIFEIY